MSRLVIYAEVDAERRRQLQARGEQSLPMVPHYWMHTTAEETAARRKMICDNAEEKGSLAWFHVLMEEVAEVFAEVDPDRQRAELIQVAAVAVQMIEDLDRKAGHIRVGKDWMDIDEYICKGDIDANRIY